MCKVAQQGQGSFFYDSPYHHHQQWPKLLKVIVVVFLLLVLLAFSYLARIYQNANWPIPQTKKKIFS